MSRSEAASDGAPPRLLIVDDHTLFARGVALLVEQSLGWAVAIAGRVEDAERQVREAASQGEPTTLVLLDLELPGVSGLEGLSRLRALAPELPVVVCSSHVGELARRAALERGARAYVNKAEPPEELLASLRRALRGPAVVASAQSGSNGDDSALLPPRQREVLLLLTEGKSNKVIARALGLAENTVRNHVAALLERLAVANRHEAAAAAERLGLLK
jgi:DNA-binding NarL/FixJ family response regulator